MQMCQVNKMTKAQAVAAYQKLVQQYGLQWTAAVPQTAYDRMSYLNKILSASDRRSALGLLDPSR